MALVVGTNTFIALADADTYHSDRGNASWAAATETDRQSALIKATDYITDHYSWKGLKTVSSQGLAWPRTGATDEDGYELSSDVIPEAVKRATSELALLIIGGESLTAKRERGGNVKREKIGPLETEYMDSATPGDTYPAIDRLVRGLIQSRMFKRAVRA
jgi:hypothetical protein